MSSIELTVPEPWSPASAAEIAAAAGAADLFVFRRIAEGRYAHLGGAGRGTGWAGIVEVSIEEEPLLAEALARDAVLRRTESEPWHVLGPYYACAVALVPVGPDVFVVFGAPDDALSALTDGELIGLARLAGGTLVEVAPAKRLADELEALNALQDLLHMSAETFDDALQRLVDLATASLSCDLGLAYVREGRRVKVCDLRGGAELAEKDLVGALAAIGERATFPVCVQRASAGDLLEPFRVEDGAIAYYLLEIRQPLPGFLLLLHTTAGTARGFTMLCQSLGRKLVDAAEPLLAAAQLRDSMREELVRAEAEARRDSLTGLANRLGWTEAVAAAAVSPRVPASVVKLDCRGLKRINETEGHQAGDRMLCRVARLLTASVRSGDVVARPGGDEFSILLCDADEQVTGTIIERIEIAVEKENCGETLHIGLAIGVATTEHDLGSAEEVADSRMLEAKRLGRLPAVELPTS